MSNVTVVKGNLFSAPKGSIICHACNCEGAWGAGVALQFKKRYPKAYKQYQLMCRENGANVLGSCLLIEEGDFTIACLFTSTGFGSRMNSVPEILDATVDAIGDLIFQNTKGLSIHMPKINSGLFGVKWELTEDVLKDYQDQEFTVWEI